jgi:hypothetical protein
LGGGVRDDRGNRDDRENREFREDRANSNSKIGI